MKQADVIRKLIKSKGLSQRKFAENINMPKSTLTSILQRGVDNSGLENVKKICKGLDITIGELEEMAEKETLQLDQEYTIAANGAENLTENEMKEVEEYIQYIISKRNG